MLRDRADRIAAEAPLDYSNKRAAMIATPGTLATGTPETICIWVPDADRWVRPAHWPDPAGVMSSAP